MNANTRLRLWKEARALLPMWAAAAGLMVLPFLLASRGNQLGFASVAFVFGCAVLSPIAAGHEFQHRTMAGLMAQPVSRRRLWWEKMTACGVALSLLTVLLLLLAWCYLRRSGFGNGFWHEAGLDAGLGPGTLTDGPLRYIEVFRKTGENWILFALTSLGQGLGFVKADPHVYRELRWTPDIMWVVGSFFGPPVIGFCTGPVCTLIARSTLGGATLTFLGPWFLMIVGVLLLEWFGVGVAGLDDSSLLAYYAMSVLVLYSGAMFLYGCRRFQRLEDVSLIAQEFAAPAQFNTLFARLTSGLAPERDSLTANLVRKELRLQRPAFFVAALLVVLWVVLIGLWRVRPEVGAAVLLVPAILLGLGIPVLVGIVSTAEERSLGVHEWHLTLPVSARRLWTVKVLVALGVNALLGLLLPGLLAHTSSWLADNARLVAEIPGLPFLIGNLVIVCAALYASTVAVNPMRALIGTMLLFAVVPLVYFLVERGIGARNIRIPREAWNTGWYLASGAHGVDSLFLWHRFGLAGLTICLLSLQVIAATLLLRRVWSYPLANFRCRPDSAPVATLQVATMTGIIVGLLFTSFGVAKAVEYFWNLP